MDKIKGKIIVCEVWWFEPVFYQFVSYLDYFRIFQMLQLLLYLLIVHPSSRVRRLQKRCLFQKLFNSAGCQSNVSRKWFSPNRPTWPIRSSSHAVHLYMYIYIYIYIICPLFMMSNFYCNEVKSAWVWIMA